MVAFLIIIYAPFVGAVPLEDIKLPKGFHISVYAENLDDVRELAVMPSGLVFAGTDKAGKVYALLPRKTLDKARAVVTVARDLPSPYGVAVFKRDLYVATRNQILQFPNIENRLSRKQYPRIIRTKLPDNKWHGAKYIAFGPHGRLYESIAMPCNTCLMKDKRYGTIVRMQHDGSYFEVFARGIRQSLGFDWHPNSLNFWFSDIGQKLLGNSTPPDEINCAVLKQLHFGFPYFYGHNNPAPHFGHLIHPKYATPPTLSLPAHVVPAGMIFYRGHQFPQQYKDIMFVALHGRKIEDVEYGAQIIWVKTKNSRVLDYNTFASGWIWQNKAWGRPTDIKMMPDGALLVSDSLAHVIYRIAYTKQD